MSPRWSNPTRYFVLTLILAALIWLIVSAQQLINVLAISALLAYLVNPIVNFVNERARLSRHYIVPLVFLLSLGIMAGAGAIIIPLLPRQMSGLMAELARIIIQIERALLSASNINLFGFDIAVDEMLSNTPLFSGDFIQADVILNIVSAATTNLMWVLVIIVTTYYLLLDWASLREWLIRLAPESGRGDVRRLYEEVKSVWQRYLRGQLLLMLLIGLITGVGTAVIGLPGFLAFGLLAGIFDIVLTIGPTVVMIIAALVALFAGSTFLPISNLWFTVLVLGLFSAIQTIENVWLRPRVMGHSLRLHPAVVFIGVIGSLALAGVLAALIIVPVIGSAMVIGRYLRAKILDLDPWPMEDVLAEPETMETDAEEKGEKRSEETAVSSLPS
jgi:predicted PurR-regulated permease PerM